MVYETLELMAGGALVFLIVVAVIWATSGGNGANVPPEPQDNVYRSDTPGHPEYATQRATEDTCQISTGGMKRWDGVGKTVYVNSDPNNADWHSQQRNIEYMENGNRAANVGITVRHVSAAERDRLSAMRGSGSQVWHNTAETSPITETHSGGMSDGAKLAAGIFMVAITGGVGIVCAIILAMR